MPLVNVPRIVETVANDPRDMVRVQLSSNDTRSYTRLEAEKLIAGGSVPGAFIVGDPSPDVTDDGDVRMKGEGSTFEEAADDLKAQAGAKAQRSSANKARTARPSEPPSESPDSDGGQAETKPAETKGE